MKAIIRKIMGYFFRGLLALLPLIVTLYIGFFMFGLVVRIVDGSVVFIPKHYRDIPYIMQLTQIAVTLLLFSLIVIFGMLLKTFMGRGLLKAIEAVLNLIPGIKVVYRAIRQVIDLVSIKKQKQFMKPVLVEWPGPDRWIMGFITGDAGDRLSPDTVKKYYLVFIPTTPNPTSGYLSIIPEDKIRPLDISVEESFKLIFTGGMVQA